MKSAAPGKSTSAVEVTNVSVHGFWILIHDREVFVSFKDFPWFEEASIQELVAVDLPSPHHLYWPALDIDLTVDSLDHPERYPLVSRRHRHSRTPGSQRIDKVASDALRQGYTLGMKIAVSMPDEVFAKAERLARRARLSRSAIFSAALKE